MLLSVDHLSDKFLVWVVDAKLVYARMYYSLVMGKGESRKKDSS